jgi:hemerythrin-like domain-containing protein
MVTLRRVLGRLARQFDTHMAAEDERLYPAFAAVLPEANPGIETLRTEHAELRELLTRITTALQLPPDSRRDEAIRVHWSDFSELLRIHIRKEESVVFHVAERVVPEKEWRRIAARRFPRTTRRAPGSRDLRKEPRP